MVLFFKKELLAFDNHPKAARHKRSLEFDLHASLRHRLAGLPPLDPAAHRRGACVCKICGQMAMLFDVVDLQKHCSTGSQYQFGLAGIEIPYFRCAACSFLFTPFFDTWTKEDSEQFIYNADYIQVDPEYAGARSMRLAAIMAQLLRGAEGLRILDYGSGFGAFAASMRREGFTRIESYDPFSSPAPPEGLFDLVTCFEVLEHMPLPLQAVQQMGAYLVPDGCLIFSQSLQPPDIGDIRGAWWYLAPRNGHVSMFALETLHRLLPSPSHTLHGNGWLWAYVPASPAPALSSCIASLGPAIVALLLRPPGSGSDDIWHPAEPSASGPFRWSGSPTMRWEIATPPRYPARLTVRIPYHLEIEPGFAAACRVEVGGLAAATTVTAAEILAEIELPAPEAGLAAALHTPAPRSPFDIRGAADGRRLGLCMLTG